jgi:hypothetical protein
VALLFGGGVDDHLDYTDPLVLAMLGRPLGGNEWLG